MIVERDTAGGTRAELSYERSGDGLNPSFRDFAIRIYEEDVLVFDRELGSCCRDYARRAVQPEARRSPYVTWMAASPRWSSTSTAAAGTAAGSLLSTARADDTYARSKKNWGPKRQRLGNIVGGPDAEWLSHDDRFLKPYGCNFCWRYLPHVWRFDDGEFRDVRAATRRS